MDCDKCAWGKIYGCGRGGDFEDACEAIEEAPTVIEAEKEQDSFKPKEMDCMHTPTISDCIKAYEDAYRVAKYRLCLLEEDET